MNKEKIKVKILEYLGPFGIHHFDCLMDEMSTCWIRYEAPDGCTSISNWCMDGRAIADYIFKECYDEVALEFHEPNEDYVDFIYSLVDEIFLDRFYEKE